MPLPGESTVVGQIGTDLDSETFETDEETQRKAVLDKKYKSELCKNWIETSYCRYESRCRFAHGQHELTEAAMVSYNDKFKSKNCRTFYQTNFCMYGPRCIFRHEHRRHVNIHRHYYTPQVYIREMLFDKAHDQAAFVESFESQTEYRLQVFQEIHDEYDGVQFGFDAKSENETSEIDFSADQICAESKACSLIKQGSNDNNSGNSLNTTIDSGSAEERPKAEAFGKNLQVLLMSSDSSAGESSNESDDDEFELTPLSCGIDFV